MTTQFRLGYVNRGFFSFDNCPAANSWPALYLALPSPLSAQPKRSGVAAGNGRRGTLYHIQVCIWEDASGRSQEQDSEEC